MAEKKKQIIVAAPEQATMIEAAAVMALVEAGEDPESVEVIASSYLPAGMVYILPKGLPEPPIFKTDLDWHS